MKTLLFLLVCLLNTTAYADSEWSESTINLDKPLDIKVYRNPNCQCCHKWISHLEHHGFNVTDQLTHNLDAVTDNLGVPHAMHSCHTAVIEGYVIEGHVPAADIMRLLTQKPTSPGSLFLKCQWVRPAWKWAPAKIILPLLGLPQTNNTAFLLPISLMKISITRPAQLRNNHGNPRCAEQVTVLGIL